MAAEAGAGWGFALTGDPRFAVVLVDAGPGGRLPGGFTVTDAGTGARYHFGYDVFGVLRSRVVPVTGPRVPPGWQVSVGYTYPPPGARPVPSSYAVIQGTLAEDIAVGPLPLPLQLTNDHRDGFALTERSTGRVLFYLDGWGRVLEAPGTSSEPVLPVLPDAESRPHRPLGLQVDVQAVLGLTADSPAGSRAEYPDLPSSMDATVQESRSSSNE
jgi:hypothetical protein